MKPTIVGQSALVMGPKYDLQKTLAAYERLVDVFAGRFGATSVTTSHPEAQRRFPWPDPGKALARQIWTQLREIHDVVDEPLLHPMGGIVLKAYLLGKTWCVQDAATGAVTTPEGEDVSRLDPAPMICVYGALRPDGSHGLVSGDLMDEVGLLVGGPLLRDLRLDFDRSTINVPASAASGLTDYAFITLPHA
ncbi:MAG TPA: hypothetical protein VLC10_04285, partial [Patescibacteria group bacterium]|nr:hypothetical protein [Patescibacteria group bacterium]